MPPYAVTVRIPADNSWALAAMKTLREAASTTPDPRTFPAAEAEVGSGAGALALRWVELDASDAWEAAREAARITAEDVAPHVPDIPSVPMLTVEVEPQDPDTTRGRPPG